MASLDETLAAAWDISPTVDLIKATSKLIGGTSSGEHIFFIKARDTAGNYSKHPTMLRVVVPQTEQPFIRYKIVGADEQLSWGAPTAAFTIDGYEIREGATWETATYIGRVKSTAYTRKVDYAGSRTYWVAAVDTSDNYGVPGHVTTSVLAPGAVMGTRITDVDNNVLIFWVPPASGSLPVSYYEVRKGAAWATAVELGSNGNSTFTTVFEQSAGTYTYWVAACDSAGNLGPAVSLTVTLGQPPNFKLRATYDSTLAGAGVTLSNLAYVNGRLIGPLATGESWQQHFVNNLWASPQAQVDAGKPLYFQPGVGSASYTEVKDFGEVYVQSQIRASMDWQVEMLGAGDAPSVSVTVSWSLDNITWTSGPAGVNSVSGTNFRYVKVVATVTSAGSVVWLNRLNIQLFNKLVTDSGAGTAGVGGTVVPFNITMTGCDTPIVQPAGSTPRIPAVYGISQPNPTGFTVKIFDVSGADVGGAFSWTVRGF